MADLLLALLVGFGIAFVAAIRPDKEDEKKPPQIQATHLIVESKVWSDDVATKIAESDGEVALNVLLRDAYLAGAREALRHTCGIVEHIYPEDGA